MTNYDILNNAALALIIVLMFAFIGFIVHDAKKGRVSVKTHRKPSKAVVKLELMYPSVICRNTLHMPVKGIFHAQEMVDVLGIKQASVGYRRSADGQSIILYTLDDSRVLRRVKEVI